MTIRECFTLEEVLKAIDEDGDLDETFMEGSDDEYEDLQEEGKGYK